MTMFFLHVIFFAACKIKISTKMRSSHIDAHTNEKKKQIRIKIILFELRFLWFFLSSMTCRLRFNFCSLAACEPFSSAELKLVGKIFARSGHRQRKESQKICHLIYGQKSLIETKVQADFSFASHRRKKKRPKSTAKKNAKTSRSNRSMKNKTQEKKITTEKSTKTTELKYIRLPHRTLAHQE